MCDPKKKAAADADNTTTTADERNGDVKAVSAAAVTVATRCSKTPACSCQRSSADPSLPPAAPQEPATMTDASRAAVMSGGKWLLLFSILFAFLCKGCMVALLAPFFPLEVSALMLAARVSPDMATDAPMHLVSWCILRDCDTVIDLSSVARPICGCSLELMNGSN